MRIFVLTVHDKLRLSRISHFRDYPSSPSYFSYKWGAADWGDCICLCLTGVFLWSPQKATLDSLGTFSSYVIHRPSWSKSRQEAVTVSLVARQYCIHIRIAIVLPARDFFGLPPSFLYVYLLAYLLEMEKHKRSHLHNLKKRDIC